MTDGDTIRARVERAIGAPIATGDGDLAEAVMRRLIGHTTGWWAGSPE